VSGSSDHPSSIPQLAEEMAAASSEGGGNMQEVQERQVQVTSARPSLNERPVPPGEMLRFKRAFADTLAERECNSEILRVLDRAAADNGFIAELTYRGAQALEAYKLTLQAQAALLSGDVRWIEARLGKLNARMRTWLDCRLGQEIW
jgi:hypothetical protein